MSEPKIDETARIKKLISDHFDGSPWLDVTLYDTLQKISSAQAAKKIDDLNSIWQIVNHLTAWRETVCTKLSGESVTVTPDNFIVDITDTSEKNWKNDLKKLEKSQKTLMKFLSDSRDSDFELEYSNGHTFYEHLQAILQHDAYHLGQIVILQKLTSGKS
ncbi:MAG: DinB family protein [bacterium]